MPTYLFNCQNCESEKCIKFSVEEVNNNRLDQPVNCPDCLETMVRNFGSEILSQNVHCARTLLKPEALSSHAEDWKVAKEAKKAEAIMNEGWESKQEVMESQDMAKELEAKKGKTKGSLTTGVQAVTSKAGMEAVKQRDLKKKQDAKKQRAKLGIR